MTLTAPSRTRSAAVAAAGFGQNFVLTVVSTFMLVYLIEYAGFSTAGVAVATTVIAVTKIVDAFTDPVLGGIIDMTRTRWGKLRPYVLFSAAPVAVLTGLLFTVPDAAEATQLLYFGIVFVLWGFAYTACDVPYWGLIGSAFADPATRNRVIAAVRAVGAVALGVATLGMPWIARAFSGGETTATGWSIAVFTVSAVGMAMYLLAFFFTRERRTTAASTGLRPRELIGTLLRNRPLLMVLLGSVLGFGRFVLQAGGAVFVVIAYGDEGAFTLIGAAIIVGLVLASALTPLLLRRFSGRWLAIASSLIGAALYLAMFAAGFAQIAVILVFIFLTGICLGVFSVVQATMIADAVDDAEARLGVRNDGVSFATLTFVSKIMTALATLAFGVFVVIAGYSADAQVTPAMQQTIFAAITLVPAASCLISAVPFAFYRLGRR